MGEEAVTLSALQDDDVKADVVSEDIDSKLDESVDEKPPEAAEDTGGIEIVRAGKAGTQPEAQRDLDWIINRRLKRERRKTEDAAEAASQASRALEIERQKNQLLQLALDQKSSDNALKMPNPDDFEEGVLDPKYIADLNTYNQKFIREEIQAATANLSIPQNKDTDAFDERIKRKHYEKAYALGAQDYEAVEDVAIDVLGEEVVNHLIKSSDNAHLVLYYLGKNPDEAKDLSALIKADPLKGTLRIGRLEAELEVKPKAKSEPAPDPDEELSGGTPSLGDTLKQKYEMLVSKAQAGGPQSQKHMIAMAQLRKEAQAKGIDLRK